MVVVAAIAVAVAVVSAPLANVFLIAGMPTILHLQQDCPPVVVDAALVVAAVAVVLAVPLANVFLIAEMRIIPHPQQHCPSLLLCQVQDQLKWVGLVCVADEAVLSKLSSSR